MQQAEWIWKENENAADTWLCFVRDIGLNRKPGKVTARIAVLVWYFGKSDFTHLTAGTGGFRFEAAIDDTALVSDPAWKVRKHPAHVAAPAGDSAPNFRFLESDIRYDARLEIGDWTDPGYTVDVWGTAVILSPEQQKELGETVARGIPLFADLGTRDFVNSDDVRGVTLEKFCSTRRQENRSPCGRRIIIPAPTGTGTSKVIISPGKACSPMNPWAG